MICDACQEQVDKCPRRQQRPTAMGDRSMKLYIAGPMTGLAEYNYPAFRAAEELLRGLGYEVLNPINAEQHNMTGAPQSWLWYMRHSLKMLAEADGIALLPAWEQSRGARLENYIGSGIGLDVRDINDWEAA